MQDISSFEKTILGSVERHDMLGAGETVLVAVSGGRDSVALMHALLALRAHLKITIVIGHFNHRLRAKHAQRDQHFVESCAERANVRCVVGSGNVRARARRDGLSIEEAARAARYEFFAGLRKKEGIDVVATGHMLDDQAETVLMRILKGSGLTGVAGIRPVFEYGGLRVIRPLIDLSRADIDAYVSARDLCYVEDETNQDERFVRNKIRSQVVPYLQDQINPQVKYALARFAASAQPDSEYMHGEALKVYPDIVRARARDLVVLKKAAFVRLHPALQFRVFARALSELQAAEELTFRHWQTFQTDLGRGRKCSFTLGDDVRIHQHYDEIIIARQGASREGVLISVGPEETVDIPSRAIRIEARRVPAADISYSRRATIEYFDCSTLTFPLRIRTRSDGDALIPLGMKGKKKVKDILIDKKVPLYKRSDALVVESGGRIVWLMPYCIADHAKVTSKTKTALCLSITPLFS